MGFTSIGARPSSRLWRGSRLETHLARLRETALRSLAAHVEHVRFYLDVLNDVMQKEEVTKVDWREIWQSVREVTPEEWEGQRRRLRESYERVLGTIRNYDRWQGEYGISGSLAVLTHTAYHLGGIRQAVCGIRSAKNRG